MSTNIIGRTCTPEHLLNRKALKYAEPAISGEFINSVGVHQVHIRDADNRLSIFTSTVFERMIPNPVGPESHVGTGEYYLPNGEPVYLVEVDGSWRFTNNPPVCIDRPARRR